MYLDGNRGKKDVSQNPGLGIKKVYRRHIKERVGSREGQAMEGSSSSLPKKARTMEGPSSPKVGKRMFPPKLLLGLVFAGWLMMWVVLPTSTYRKTWQPKLVSETMSTYFGRQGYGS